MVAKAGGYYGSDFRGSRGVTKRDLLSTTIFNVVAYAVVRHWVKVTVESAEEKSGRGQEGRHQNAFFYLDDGMVMSLDPRWLQGAFSTLLGLFDRVGLKKNSRKTFGMVFHPCQAAGMQSEAAYRLWMMGARPYYWERQCVWIKCA